MLSETATPAPDAGTTLERARMRSLVDEWIRESTERGEVEDGALPDYLAELEALADLSFREKVERAGMAAVRREQDADAIAEEIKRLQARKQARENAARRIRDYLQVCLELAGETKVEGALCTVSIQKNGGAPAIRWTLPPEQLPEAFRRTPSPPALDTDAARQYLKAAGRLPDGFEIAGPTYSLRIR